MSLLSQARGAAGRQSITAALDIGTTKITCLIAKVTDTHDDVQPEIRVLGIGHQGARGIRAGVVVDMEAAEDAIRAAVAQAETMAGVTIRHVWLNVSNPSLEGRILSESVMLHSGEVEVRDLRKVLREARSRAYASARETIHAVPIGFSVDHSKGIKDPEGMQGEALSVNMHEITTDPGPLRNLALCVERCHLEPEGPIFSAYASALAAVVDDEMELGVTVIELGGGTTSIASFFEGRIVFAKTLGVGGLHVTQDIARGLSTPMADAERMKTMYGSTLASPNDDREMIDVPPIGEEANSVANHVPRSMLVGIIQPRIEETLELVRDAIAAGGATRIAGHRIVLTGGASQLTGLRELAGRIFDAHVRIGTPRGLTGLPDGASGPSFTTAAGLLTYNYRAPMEAPQPSRASAGLGGLLRSLLGFFGLGRGPKAVTR